MAKYRVIGSTSYLGYEPGEEFVAELEPDAVARALHRGDIEVLSPRRTVLDPGSVVEPPRQELDPGPTGGASSEETTEEH